VSLLFELLGFLLSGITIAISLLVHAPGEDRLGLTSRASGCSAYTLRAGLGSRGRRIARASDDVEGRSLDCVRLASLTLLEITTLRALPCKMTEIQSPLYGCGTGATLGWPLSRRARYRFLPFPLFQARPKRNGDRRTTRPASSSLPSPDISPREHLQCGSAIQSNYS
jgi:hypothetical protein